MKVFVILRKQEQKYNHGTPTGSAVNNVYISSFITAVNISKMQAVSTLRREEKGTHGGRRNKSINL